MKSEAQLPSQVASLSDIAKAAAVAFVVALVLLFTVILPAEYGIDPLGTGSALGLTQISAATPLPEEVALPGASNLTPVQEGPLAHYPSNYNFESVEFEVGPYEYLEYKYRLEQGATMLYTWTASSIVVHDFHGEKDGAPADQAEQSFEKRDREKASGTFTAPFSGIHGWYWENPGGDTVRIKLTTAGFYSSGLEIRSDRSRHPHEVTPIENVSRGEGQ